MLDIERYGKDVKQINKVIRYKNHGYQLAYYTVYGATYGCQDFDMCTAFTWPDGWYIGDKKIGYYICAKRGIKPEKIQRKELPKAVKAKRLLKEGEDETMRPCSIGFCEEENKWYGWSHRAIYGFTIGSKVVKGSCGFTPRNKQEFVEDTVNFYTDDDDTNIKYELDHLDKYTNEKGMRLTFTTVQDDGGTINHDIFTTYPAWGRGEWKAKTMEDAKQMAIDFARGVS